MWQAKNRLRVFKKVTEIIFISSLSFYSNSCKNKAKSFVECYKMVYQNPDSAYLNSLDISNFPRKSAYFFIRTNGVNQLDSLRFVISHKNIHQKIILHTWPKDSKGMKLGNDMHLILVTNYFEKPNLIDSIVKNYKVIKINYIKNNKLYEVSFPNKKYFPMNELTIDKIDIILSKAKNREEMVR